MNPLVVKTWAEREFGPLDGLVQGIAVATVIGITAQFLSEHYGAPAMLMALLLFLPKHNAILFHLNCGIDSAIQVQLVE